MVAKISHGTSLYGALAYNYGKVAAGTAEILSGNRMISDRLGLPGTDIRLALLSFENYLLANRNTEKPVLHIALSPAPEDRQTDVQLELETDFGLRNGADTEKRDLKAEPGKVDVSAGDIQHQIGSTLKAVLEGYRFQSFGEYSALLSAFNIEAGLVKGEYKGVPYTGIVYSATDGRARVVSPPFKSSRFGKRFGYEGISKRMLAHTKDFKAGRWAPDIQRQVAEAMCRARSRKELVEMLEKGHIGVVFRENENGRIYGVTFIDHRRREVFNGSRMGKEFSANAFHELFRRWENRPENGEREDDALRYGRHRKAEGDSTLEQAAGILTLETNPAVDYEEEAFRRRMKRKKKQAKRKSRGI